METVLLYFPSPLPCQNKQVGSEYLSSLKADGLEQRSLEVGIGSVVGQSNNQPGKRDFKITSKVMNMFYSRIHMNVRVTTPECLQHIKSKAIHVYNALLNITTLEQSLYKSTFVSNISNCFG